MEYDLTLQQQFGHSTVFSLSYLAALSRELPKLYQHQPGEYPGDQ